MLGIIDAEKLGYPVVSLPGVAAAGVADGCPKCAAHRPEPDLSGNLQVDPEVHLPSVGMDVEIAYFYNANSAANGSFGYGRTFTTNLTCQASGSPLQVALARGNGTLAVYRDDGTGNFVPQSVQLVNSLTKDTANNLWKETTPDGRVTAYPLDTTGMVTSVTWAQDAVGNTHTFTYSSGLLVNLHDAVGRLVTFGYAANPGSGSGGPGSLLQSIQDWQGRRTTFAYDTSSVPGQPMLTTVTGPSGCQTQYQYNGTAKLTGIVDPNGYGTSYVYDSLDRVSSRAIAGVGVTTYSYSGDLVALQPAVGGVVTNTITGSWRLGGTVDASAGQDGPSGRKEVTHSTTS